MSKECRLKVLSIIWLLSPMLLYADLATAQQNVIPGYTLKTYGAADGLLSSEILSIYQDKKDFIWIGTRSGISRYDGRQFQNFEYAGQHYIGAVASIAEDEAGQLWISTESGLHYWNGKAFTHYSFLDEGSFLPFTVIHFTAQGEVWIGTAKGPVHLPALQAGNKEELIKNVLPTWKDVALHDESVTTISSSNKGVVIGATMMVFFYQNGALKNLPNPLKGRDRLCGVFIDSNGIVYWTNLLTGCQFWSGNKTAVPILYPGMFYTLFASGEELHFLSNAGILTLDKNAKKLTRRADLSLLHWRMPSCLLIDKEGAYWAGSAEGIFHIRKTSFTVHSNGRLPYADDTYSMLQRANGDLIIGANRGRIFTFRDSLQPYRQLSQVVPLAEVFSMYEDGENELWFGTGYQGIARYKNDRLQNFTKQNGLPDNTHYAFLKSTRNELWTAGDMGLTRINRLPNDSVSFQPFFYYTNMAYHKIFGMAEAPDGTIWAGGELGLFYLQADSLRTYSLPELKGRKLFVTAMKKDKNGDVWLCTRGNGIFRCAFGSDGKLRVKDRWTVEEGLPSNSFLSIAFDSQNNAWAGSYHGVTAILQTASGISSIKNFSLRDAHINNYYKSLAMYFDGDQMWACTSSGVVSFRPDSLLQQPRKAQLYITAINLLNTKKTAEEFLALANNKDAGYRFPHDVNSFSIQYAALYYTNPDAVQYYYQLQGVDSNWTSAGKERTILFSQLPPGRYTVLVKASIGGSDWTNTASLDFEISKPWWQQWWLPVSAGITLFSMLWIYIRKREKNLKQREQQKTELEKLRAGNYQQRLEIEQVINYFSASLNEHNTIDSVLWDVARNCISQLGFEDCVIYLKNDAGDALIQKAAWGPKTTNENKIVAPIEIPLGKGIVGTVALTGKEERLDDTSIDDRYIVDDLVRASEICVPIFDKGLVIGVIDSEHSQPAFYTDRHLHILKTIASHCGAKISTLRAEAITATARLEALLNRQRALEASLQSMRLQMNPHFLFNALNSIQQMILSGDETTATRFLSKFSKLLRTVLTYSDKEEISLKEEMELLRLYVELESLRFKDAFSFFITCDRDIDTEEVFVPVLLFQPIVENAIWHGLMHRDGGRQLAIQFAGNTEGCLRCSIEDNGVGRNASSSINGKAERHTGKGLSVTMERLAVLNEKNGTKNVLQIIDIKNEKGSAAGTRIEITLYYQ